MLLCSYNPLNDFCLSETGIILCFDMFVWNTAVKHLIMELLQIKLCVWNSYPKGIPRTLSELVNGNLYRRICVVSTHNGINMQLSLLFLWCIDREQSFRFKSCFSCQDVWPERVKKKISISSNETELISLFFLALLRVGQTFYSPGVRINTLLFYNSNVLKCWKKNNI